MLIYWSLFRHPDAWPIQLPILAGEFRHFNGLIYIKVSKDLCRLACWPVDFEPIDGAALAQADGLLERVAAEAATTADMAMDGQRLRSGSDNLYAGANGGSIGLLADELHG